VLAACIVLSAAVSSQATVITTCGQTIAADDTGVLLVDLDCSSSPFGVRLLRRATLDLNGHAIAGGSTTAATVLGAAVVNDADLENSGRGKFTIVGPGVISGVLINPVTEIGTDACVSLGNGRGRITSATGVVEIHHCIRGVRGRLGANARNNARLEIDHAILHDNAGGVAVRRVTASDVTVYNTVANGIGLQAGGTMVATNVTAHDNGIGLFATKRLRGTNIVAQNNANGVESFGSIWITNLLAIDNTYLWGVSAPRLTLFDSTVTGNANADLSSRSRPRLINTTCGTSAVLGGDGSWGVCTND
jgi:hypothetical protein